MRITDDSGKYIDLPDDYFDLLMETSKLNAISALFGLKGNVRLFKEITIREPIKDFIYGDPNRDFITFADTKAFQEVKS